MEAHAPPPKDDDESVAGWYTDPDGRADRRYWDGVEWTDYYEADGRVMQLATESRVDRAMPTAVPAWAGPWALLLLLAVAWAAAEAHDTNCYTKATLSAFAEAASGGTSEEQDCLLLPWNDPSDD